MCHEEIQPITCILCDCKWSYDGKKALSGGAVQSVRSDWLDTPVVGAYQIFDYKGNIADWRMLVYMFEMLDTSVDQCAYLAATVMVSSCDVHHGPAARS